MTASDIVSPLTLTTNIPIMVVVNRSDSPHVETSFEPGGHSIVVRWKLFNQGIVGMFDVLADSGAGVLKTSLNYEIVGIPKIKEETGVTV